MHAEREVGLLSAPSEAGWRIVRMMGRWIAADESVIPLLLLLLLLFSCLNGNGDVLLRIPSG